MKREEKNQQTRRRILDSALDEFSKQGYGASSINAVCATQNISKGIIYHYFKTKDDLFLSCVEECFDRLTEYLRDHIQLEQGSIEERLEGYFTARLAFFQEHPVYQRIFCEAVMTPPAHLKGEIQAQKRAFDALNIQILEQLLEPVSLRTHITKADVIETFQQFQDFINAKYEMTGIDRQGFEAHEASCKKALNILLYGVIAREETANV